MAFQDRPDSPKGVQDRVGGHIFSIQLAKAKLGFSAAHFLVIHEKCSRLHGHNYKVRVAVRGEQDESGMVVDFQLLTQAAMRICNEIDQHLVVPGKAPGVNLVEKNGEIKINLPDRQYRLPIDDVVILPIEASTAEAFAKYIYDRLSSVVDGLAYVEVEESPGAVARYQPS